MRKEFEVGDEMASIKIKLWGDDTERVGPEHKNQLVLVKNIALDRYGGRNTMSATPETEIVVSEYLYVDTMILGRISKQDRGGVITHSKEAIWALISDITSRRAW